MIIIAKCVYSDQYSSVDSVTGIFDNLEKAIQYQKHGSGYIRLFEAELNTTPLKLKEIK